MRIHIVSLFLILSTLSYAQQYQLSGYVKDAESGETLIGARVFVPESSQGTLTNEYGFYSLQVDGGVTEIIFSYIGYQPTSLQVNLTADTSQNVSLQSDDYLINEVVVTFDEKDRKLATAEMSVNQISAETIQKIPAVLGEVDLVKSIQLLPGVTNNGEGSNGFNVRGGAEDQNLVLLDEAIIYNSAHVLGFFSVFNNDAIKDVKLYKGGIPAKFGGRVASVLDVRQKDGNDNQFHLRGGLGLISSRLMAEGPIGKDKKSSFLVAGRSSYVNLFLRLANNDNSLGFYDLNTKVNIELSEKDQLYLSGYFGNDVFTLGNFFTNAYGNETANLRWNHVYSNNLFSNVSAIYSRYRYKFDFDAIQFEWNSGIKNLNVKYDFDWFPSNAIDVKFGASINGYQFNPGEIEPTSDESSINYQQLEQKRAIEGGLYAHANHDISPKFSAQYGLRYSNFYRLGGQKLNVYQNQGVVYNPITEVYGSAQPIGEVEYAKSDVIADFHNLEPRVALAYQVTKNNSLKASYNRTAQYIHLISNTASPTPLDVWAPSGQFIEPQIANQYAVGLFQNIGAKQYSLELEGYYKTVDNRLDYIDGADLIGNDAIEQDILAGETRSYGAEFMFSKNSGPLTGWLAYTYSRAEQRTPGGIVGGLGINDGNWYFANFDRTHDLGITGIYELNDKWTFSSNFVLQSGRPVTYPNAQYTYQNLQVPNFTERNSFRLPAYHRLDLAATMTPKNNKEQKVKSEWVFGIYNAYDRRNASSIRFAQNTDTGVNEATKLSIFGIVPSATWNFKF